MFVRSTALLAIAVLAAGCSSGGSNSGITGTVPATGEFVGASIGASSNNINASFSVAGLNNAQGLPSVSGNLLQFTIGEAIKGQAVTTTFTVTPNPASCISVTTTDGLNFAATASCTTLPTSGTFNVVDTSGNAAPLIISATP